MNDTAADRNGVDAFLLYNERETLIPDIAEALRAAGRRVHFWRTDIKIGEAWMPRELDVLASAKTVVVFLGPKGWGPTQEMLAAEAVERDRPIIPVLIGAELPAEQLDRANGLFRHHRYLQMSPKSWRDDFPKLLAALPVTTGQHPFITTILEGDDEARHQALQTLRNSAGPSPEGLIVEMVELLEGDLAPDTSHPHETSGTGSARSWMLTSLVELADIETVQRFALRHLGPDREPIAFVRFRLLAALAHRFPRLAMSLAEAATRDPNRNVRFLAEMISWGDEATVRSRVLAELQSDDPEAALFYFRVLPIPSLLGSVAQLLGRYRSEHPVLDALTENVPAANAAHAILAYTSVEEAVPHILRSLNGVDRARRRRYAALLAAFPTDETELALQRVEASDPSAKTHLRDMRLLMRRQGAMLASELPVAGYRSDSIEGTPDYLDIQRDVEAVTAVMLARELSPPLAIGLFGEWGAGKSFFMRAMKTATAKLKRTFPERFCQEVVEIDFNAWHYADGNLWASLVSHILERLSTHVAPPPSSEQQESALVLELQSAKLEVSGLEKEKRDTEATIKEQEESLYALRLKRETAEVKLSQLRAADLRSIFDDGALRDSVNKALNDLGAPAALTNIEDLQAVVRRANGIGGRIIALCLSLMKDKHRKWSIGLLGAVAVLPLLLGWATSVVQPYLAPIVAFITAFVTLAGGGAPLIMAGLKTVSTNLDRLEKAKTAVDDAVARKRAEPTPQEETLRKELARLMGQEEGIALRLRVAEKQVSSLEGRITALKESRSLQWFLADRSGSDDYRKHLGVMGTIRRDFEGLVDRLQRRPESDQRGVDRIILYIDDLDRCPAPKVVEVLEAVHLLLAFPLFVVVVGVDPRWLAHALSVHHTALTEPLPQSAAHQPDRRATPQDFLEKIFQIPLTLRPMSPAGLSGLMESLLETTTGTEADPNSTPPNDRSEPDKLSSDFVLGDSVLDQPEPSQAPSSVDPDDTGPTVQVLSVEALRITPSEARFAADLHGIFATPRAVKRFTNTYRLLKAQISDVDRQRLEGDEHELGEYPIPMMLLGLAISQKAAAKEALRILKTASEGTGEAPGTWRTQIKSIAQVEMRTTLLKGLDTSDQAIERVGFWLPKIARYTFDGLR